MKKSTLAAAALALSTLFTTAAHAKPVDITGCSQDDKTLTLKTDIEGTVTVIGTSATVPLSDMVQDIFALTAKTMTAEDFAGEKGSEAITANLRAARSGIDLSDDASLKIFGAPVIGGTCTP